MSSESLEQRARELLAAEYEQRGMGDDLSASVRRGAYVSQATEAALQAIIRALESTPAQEVPTWDAKERAAIAEMMEAQELSEPQLIRQALRQYQHDWLLRRAGETCTWSGDAQRARDFAGDSARTAPAEGEQTRINHLMEALANAESGMASLFESGDYGIDEEATEQGFAILEDIRAAVPEIKDWAHPGLGRIVDALTATTAPVADLEQFREVVEDWRDDAVQALSQRMTESRKLRWQRRIDEADRLLAIIDTARPAKAEGDAR